MGPSTASEALWVMLTGLAIVCAWPCMVILLLVLLVVSAPLVGLLSGLWAGVQAIWAGRRYRWVLLAAMIEVSIEVGGRVCRSG